MRAVAEWRGAGVFAVAEGNALGFLNLEFQWLEVGPLVRAIAVGLVLRVTTATPPIGAGREFEFSGCLAAIFGGVIVGFSGMSFEVAVTVEVGDDLP